jgi:large subunit ribosomal protein L15
MRGGKGRAGGRKHFWIRTVKYEPDRYEKKGFLPPSAKKPRPETLNLGELNDMIETNHDKLIIDEEGAIDLDSMGYGKLLGRGEISKKIKVKVRGHTQSAREKIEGKDGEIIIDFIK